MTLHWYRPPNPGGDTLADMLERLRPLGVRWQHRWPGYPVTYRFVDGELVAEIGAITVHPATGIIAVWPAAGIGPKEQRVLCGSAQRAFELPPRKADGWSYTRPAGRPLWRSYVVTAVTDEGVGRMVTEHHASMYWDRHELDRAAATTDGVEA